MSSLEFGPPGVSKNQGTGYRDRHGEQVVSIDSIYGIRSA